MPLQLDQQRFGDPEQRVRILKRDKYQCRYCWAKLTIETANLDHIKPWQNGGRSIDKNLVACCQECNKAKGNDTWTPTRPIHAKKRKLSYNQRKRRADRKEEKGWASKSGPVVVIEPGIQPSTG